MKKNISLFLVLLLTNTAFCQKVHIILGYNFLHSPIRVIAFKKEFGGIVEKTIYQDSLVTYIMDNSVAVYFEIDIQEMERQSYKIDNFQIRFDIPSYVDTLSKLVKEKEFTVRLKLSGFKNKNLRLDVYYKHHYIDPIGTQYNPDELLIIPDEFQEVKESVELVTISFLKKKSVNKLPSYQKIKLF